jgi:putative ABC transport system substrate-binding protein
MLMFIVHRARVTEFAARHKLPAVYPFLLPVTDANGLMAYTVKASELDRNAAAYVDRILKGAKVSDLPVQQPTQFEFVINLKTAKAWTHHRRTAAPARSWDLFGPNQ